MTPPWRVNKTNIYTHNVDREKISQEVLGDIDRWAGTVTLTQTNTFKCYFISPKRVFQIWNARLPDPDHRKGKSGGFRLVCFFLEGMIFLDMIERRNDLGGKREHSRAQQEYTKYLEELKKYLMDTYESKK